MLNDSSSKLKGEYSVTLFTMCEELSDKWLQDLGDESEVWGKVRSDQSKLNISVW